MRCLIVGLLIVVMGGVVLLSPCAVFADELLDSDCTKCHKSEVKAISSQGAQHQKAIACTDCHLEHLPRGQKTVPECALCHARDEKPHYAVSGCLECHDPHAPLQIVFADGAEVKPVCVSCHQAEGKQLLLLPNRHAELDCTACHAEHGTWRDCLQCHAGHDPGMSYADCLVCHKPHMPTVVKYDVVELPNAWCAECHGEVVATLAANRTKHHDLSCVYCHKYQHKLIPTCETCHGQPHGVKMHRKYPDCRECHHGPHALDRLP